VLCVDNFFTGTRRNIEHLLSNKSFELLRHDITHPLFVEVDEIFNLACPASPIHYKKDQSKQGGCHRTRRISSVALGCHNMTDMQAAIFRPTNTRTHASLAHIAIFYRLSGRC
jgi:hypothetical protein